ncbi:hypothetical protein Syun_009713 [Stephania yunnanensis]|uniref:Uncharacterized protein n=1 Tax=Stephania yunnanensis TaxID=152371 RepID=A0AAP0PQX6_9MAGN
MPSCQFTGVKLGPTAVSVCKQCIKGKARGGKVAEESTRVKLEPTAMSVCKRCMKGKEKGGGVAEEGSHGSNEIEALDESAMPFMSVCRGEARTDSVSVRAAADEEE